LIYYLGTILSQLFGPARLLQSYTVLIVAALYSGFVITVLALPRLYRFLPCDRGREFVPGSVAAKGKPTGAGVIFISFFVFIVLIIAPLRPLHLCVLALTELSMLTGFLDDQSAVSWGEYRKGLLDLFLSLAASIVLYYFLSRQNDSGQIQFWFPFVAKPITVAPWAYILVSVCLLWGSINSTNCTDGVDGLSGTLVLIALLTLGVIFYFIIGHKEIAAYLLVPHMTDGAAWGLITFTLAGALMGYLWHNAYPSQVLMGDAGSRALGFFIGICVLVTGNPFLILATSTIIFIDGGLGLVKLFVMRFFKIPFLTKIRFPLHDHFRHNYGWSPTQVLLKFVILQVLVSVALLGIFFKVR
jgi:phospho-N-acetylmuramoyl-pentapeptide-transferase